MCQKTSLLISCFNIDYIYVDARHDYCAIAEDLNDWWPKLKQGGILAGHDFLNNEQVKKMKPREDWGLCEDGSRNDGAVRGAVEEFAKKYDLSINVVQGEWCPSWIIRKPITNPKHV